MFWGIRLVHLSSAHEQAVASKLMNHAWEVFAQSWLPETPPACIYRLSCGLCFEMIKPMHVLCCLSPIRQGCRCMLLLLAII